MKNFIVKGAKWFDKVNGNTYCNAKVFDNNGKLLFVTGFEYGYGSYYKQKAEKMIKERSKAKNINIIDMGASYIKYWDCKKGNF